MQLIGHFIEPESTRISRERSVNFPHLPANGAVRYGAPGSIGIYEENE
jgi:hypothetical protein